MLVLHLAGQGRGWGMRKRTDHGTLGGRQSRPQARSNREARARASLRLAMFEPGVVHRHLSSQKANPSTPCRKTNDAQTWAIVAEIKGESGQPWATPRVGCIQREFRAPLRLRILAPRAHRPSNSLRRKAGASRCTSTLRISAWPSESKNWATRPRPAGRRLCYPGP